MTPENIHTGKKFKAKNKQADSENPTVAPARDVHFQSQRVTEVASLHRCLRLRKVRKSRLRTHCRHRLWQ